MVGLFTRTYGQIAFVSDRLRFVGQNVVRSKNGPQSLNKPNWAYEINTWALKSKAYLPVTNNLEFLSNFQPEVAWSAYTQLIWDFSYLVGCGFSMFRDEKLGGNITQLYVCNYGPANSHFCPTNSYHFRWFIFTF